MEIAQAGVRGGAVRSEIKNLYLYTGGKTVSLLGTTIYNFALGLYVLKLTGSAFSFAVTLLLGILPMVILNPVAGAVADKCKKKLLVVSMDLISGILLISVFLVSGHYTLNLPTIYVTTVLLTVFTTFFGVGMEASKPNLVSDKMLMTMNSVSKITDSVSSIAGPMIGGMVFALLDIRTFILLNGLSFLVSSIAMLFMDFELYRSGSHNDDNDRSIHLIRDIREGFQYLASRKRVLSLFWILIAVNFFLGFSVTVPMPYILNNVLQIGSGEFGIIQGAFPAGMIAGALVVKKVMEGFSYPSLLKKLIVSIAVSMVLIGLPVLPAVPQAGSIWYALYFGIVILGFGVMIAWIDIPFAYMMQKEIPDEYRGRVLGIGISIGKIFLPLAMIASGALLGRIPSFIPPIAGGALLLLVHVLTWKTQSLPLEKSEE